MQLAQRRRLRLPLHLGSRRCGPSPGCGAQVDAFGDHALAGFLARRAKILERASVRVAKEAGRRGWASGSLAMAGAHN